MASRLAAQLGVPTVKESTKARQFFIEICRCLPFIARLHNAEEMVSLRALRAIVKKKFVEHKDVKDDRAIDLLIFKGREELETYLMLHKQRHHLITEYVEPNNLSKLPKAKASGHSPFLDSFFSTQYPQIPQKYQ